MATRATKTMKAGEGLECLGVLTGDAQSVTEAWKLIYISLKSGGGRFLRRESTWN